MSSSQNNSGEHRERRVTDYDRAQIARFSGRTRLELLRPFEDTVPSSSDNTYRDMLSHDLNNQNRPDNPPRPIAIAMAIADGHHPPIRHHDSMNLHIAQRAMDWDRHRVLNFVVAERGLDAMPESVSELYLADLHLPQRERGAFPDVAWRELVATPAYQQTMAQVNSATRPRQASGPQSTAQGPPSAAPGPSATGPSPSVGADVPSTTTPVASSSIPLPFSAAGDLLTTAPAHSSMVQSSQPTALNPRSAPGVIRITRTRVTSQPTPWPMFQSPPRLPRTRPDATPESRQAELESMVANAPRPYIATPNTQDAPHPQSGAQHTDARRERFRPIDEAFQTHVNGTVARRIMGTIRNVRDSIRPSEFDVPRPSDDEALAADAADPVAIQGSSRGTGGRPVERVYRDWDTIVRANELRQDEDNTEAQAPNEGPVQLAVEEPARTWPTHGEVLEAQLRVDRESRQGPRNQDEPWAG